MDSGHALVALSLPGSDMVHKVSIIPRTAALMDGLPGDWQARPPVSEARQAAMDQAVHDIIAATLHRGTELLAARRTVLEPCVLALLAQETLDAAVLQALITENAT